MVTDENATQQGENQEELSDEELQELDSEQSSEESSDEEKDWKAEAHKFKGIASRLKKKVEKSQEQPKQESEPQQTQQQQASGKQEQEGDKQSDPFKETVEVARLTRDLSDDELQELETQAGQLGMSPKDLAKTPLWKNHLESVRAQKKQQEGTPQSSGRTAAAEPTPEMPPNDPKEKQKWFNQKVQSTRSNDSE